MLDLRRGSEAQSLITRLLSHYSPSKTVQAHQEATKGLRKSNRLSLSRTPLENRPVMKKEGRRSVSTSNAKSKKGKGKGKGNAGEVPVSIFLLYLIKIYE